MGKVKVKGFCGLFLHLKTVLAVFSLMPVFCVLTCIFRTGYANADSKVTLLSATVIKADTTSQPTSNKSSTKTGPRQPRTSGAQDNTVADSGDTTKRNNGRLAAPEYSAEWQTIRMRVTAYCPCRKCCGSYSDGVTACGHRIRSGDAFVAADKKYLFGTEMIIAGYKNGDPVKVLDRGGAIYENRLDVFFGSHEEALEWGVRYIDVKVLRKQYAQKVYQK